MSFLPPGRLLSAGFPLHLTCHSSPQAAYYQRVSPFIQPCHSSPQAAYYQRVFPLIHQWCTSHHFVVRLYAQQVVLQMWDDGASELFPVLKGCVDFMRQNG